MMKLKYKNLIMAVASLSIIGCQPDEYDLAGTSYTTDDLIQGISYTVVPDANDPNTIHLTNLTKGVTPLWETPSGRFQSQTLDLQLPFSGEYQITYGVETQAGPVYGAPYTFTVTTNNFGMLEDEMWTNLTGGVGKSKKWVPVDKDYGIGKCTAPLMYCDPTDIMNNKTGITDLAFEAFAPNWDPGFNEWTVPSGDPFLSSYMEFGLNESKGCTVEEFRNDADGGTMMNGKFSLDIKDKTHPLITFTDCYSLHNLNFDEVCSNYTKDIKIVELTPYMLQLATMRTNSEGAWWLIWNFIAEDVQNGTVTIPVEETPVTKTPVAEIEVNNVDSLIFTIVGEDATYYSSTVTYLINEEAPYDWMWWNGGSAAWETNGFAYNDTWAPAVTSTTEEFALTLSKQSDGTYRFEEEGYGKMGTFTIDGNKLTFSDSVTFFEAVGTSRTVAMKTTELYVIKADNANNVFYFALEDGKDLTNVVNQYLFVNLTQKSIGGGVTGPTNIMFDNSKLVYGDVEGNGKLRLEMYNQYGSGSATDPAFSTSKLKFKKEMTITFTISGIGTLANPCTATIGTGLDWKFDGTSTYSENAIITGNGTYTVKYKSDGTTKITLESMDKVFVIELIDIGKNLSSDVLGTNYVGFGETAGEGQSYFLDAANAGTAFNVVIDSFTVE